MVLKKIIKDKGIYILAFIIPWLLIALHSIFRHGWLSGQGTILSGDAGKQFYQLYVELWNKVHSGSSIFYSWNAGGGVDFYQNMAYYLISPFTIIILVLPKACILSAVQVIMILKWSGIYVSMLYYFMHTHYNMIRLHKKSISFVLASIFSLSNFILYNLCYFIWSDVIIIFPFLLLCVERMTIDCSWKKYCVLLWIAIICNFYTAYQVCIYLVVWFFFQIRKDTVNKFKKFCVFAGSSLLAGISAAMVLFPCVLGLTRYSQYDAASVSLDDLYVSTITVSLWRFIKKLFIFDKISQIDSLDPRSYISIGAVVLIMLYIGVSSINKRRCILLLLFLLSGICVGAISYVWHGFTVPHGAFHRQLYIVNFAAVFIIMDLIQNADELNKVWILAAGVIEGLLIVISFMKIDSYLQPYVYVTTMLLFVLYQLILILYVKKSLTFKQIIKIFSMLIMCELLVNAYDQLKTYNVDFSFNNHAEKLTEEITLEAGERLNVVNGMRNTGMMFDLASDELFLSYCNGNNITLHKALGMSYTDDASYSLHGASPLINVMFNQRFGISDTELPFSDAQKVDSYGTMSLYKMQRTVGLGYLVNDTIELWDPYSLDPFNAQNQYAYLVSGVKGMFEIIQPDITCSLGEEILELVDPSMSTGCYIYQYTDDGTMPSDMITMEMTVPKDMDLYVFLHSEAWGRSRVWIDDEEITKLAFRYIPRTYHLGSLKKGAKVKICTDGVSATGDNTIWYEFGSFREDCFQKVYEEVRNAPYEISEMEDNYVSGHIQADYDGIMMTSIQAVKGFTVYVDGEKAPYKTIGRVFIGVPLKKGQHVVEFRYITPYFKEGVVISCLGMLFYIILCVVEKLRKNRDEMRIY